ncbi:hypothetical protein PITC_060590 [Penicillium italicum]|uniref:Uncharacterized protein n=1 Tax=Penicillium italicum TaxID=40296 RepID=A0A0A2LF87_PENIT|nr:hypothetical protein PITC_060590 [Penicillium italicum]
MRLVGSKYNNIKLPQLGQIPNKVGINLPCRGIKRSKHNHHAPISEKEQANCIGKKRQNKMLTTSQ